MLLSSHLSGFFLLTLIGGAEVFFEVVMYAVEIRGGMGMVALFLRGHRDMMMIMSNRVSSVVVVLGMRVLNRVVRGVFARVTKTVHVRLLMFRQVFLAG